MDMDRIFALMFYHNGWFYQEYYANKRTSPISFLHYEPGKEKLVIDLQNLLQLWFLSKCVVVYVELLFNNWKIFSIAKEAYLVGNQRLERQLKPYKQLNTCYFCDLVITLRIVVLTEPIPLPIFKVVVIVWRGDNLQC